MPDELTHLLRRVKNGDQAARERMLSLVYPTLRKLAAVRMRTERPDHTLQPTALVHEVFLKFGTAEAFDVRDRGHFYAIAAEMMRQILVDSARKRRARKRGGTDQRVPLTDAIAGRLESPEAMLDVDRLLTRLALLDARQARIVEMRYFGGFSEQEIAEALGISERTVKRDWSMARAWMRKELS
jgi:RNA polymerase sigma-70 factor (ECF subfamily)